VLERHFGGGASIVLLQAAQAECDALLHPLLVRFAADRRLPALIKEARARRTAASGSGSSSGT
jgi:hypothetical protein